MSKCIVSLEHSRAYARAFILTVIIAGALVVSPIQAIFRSHRVSGALQKCFCRLVCWIIGIKVAPAGVAPRVGPRLIVANHVSWTDIIVLASLCPSNFLAKREVADWPILGNLAKRQGTLFIERGDRRQISSINAALADILRGGASVVLFPEGTSTHGVSEPYFNAAHFQAAQLAEAPILPVAILYTDENGQADVGWHGDMTFIPHLWRLLKKGGCMCRLSFGSPIDSEGKHRKSLAAEAQGQVWALLNEAQLSHAANGCALREELNSL